MDGESAFQRSGELGCRLFEVLPRCHGPILATHNGVVAIREPVEDLYAELGVDRTATRDEIAAAFRARARDLHPDVHPGDLPAAERFKRVSMAYGVLSDPARRARYDSGQLTAPVTPRAPAPTARGRPSQRLGAARGRGALAPQPARGSLGRGERHCAHRPRARRRPVGGLAPASRCRPPQRGSRRGRDRRRRRGRATAPVHDPRRARRPRGRGDQEWGGATRGRHEGRHSLRPERSHQHRHRHLAHRAGRHAVDRRGEAVRGRDRAARVRDAEASPDERRASPAAPPTRCGTGLA